MDKLEHGTIMNLAWVGYGYRDQQQHLAKTIRMLAYYLAGIPGVVFTGIKKQGYQMGTDMETRQTCICKDTPLPLYFFLSFFCVLCSLLSSLASLGCGLLRVLVVLLLGYRGKSKQFAYTLQLSRD